MSTAEKIIKSILGVFVIIDDDSEKDKQNKTPRKRLSSAVKIPRIKS